MVRIFRNKTVVVDCSDESKMRYFDSVKELGYGMYAVEQAGKFAMMDESGKLLSKWGARSGDEAKAKELFPVEWYDEIGEFDMYGLSRVRSGDRYGLIRYDGVVVASVIYHELNEFRNGYAIMGIKMDLGEEEPKVKHGFIRHDSFVILAQYDEVMPFSGGYAPVMVEHKWGFINESGNFVVKPRFDRVMNHMNGVATVESEGQCCVFEIATCRLNV